MPICKKCGLDKNIKSGKVNNKQRYECKEYGCHFVEGDNRTNDKIDFFRNLLRYNIIAPKTQHCIIILKLHFMKFRKNSNKSKKSIMCSFLFVW